MAESEGPSNVEVESLVDDLPLFLGDINQKLPVIKRLQHFELPTTQTAPAHVSPFPSAGLPPTGTKFWAAIEPPVPKSVQAYHQRVCEAEASHEPKSDLYL